MMVENDQTKILWEFQIQVDKLVMGNQPDIVVMDKQRKMTAVTDVEMPSESKIRKKEHKKPEKSHWLRGELDTMWQYIVFDYHKQQW